MFVEVTVDLPTEIEAGLPYDVQFMAHGLPAGARVDVTASSEKARLQFEPSTFALTRKQPQLAIKLTAKGEFGAYHERAHFQVSSGSPGVTPVCDKSEVTVSVVHGVHNWNPRLTFADHPAVDLVQIRM